MDATVAEARICQEMIIVINDHKWVILYNP